MQIYRVNVEKKIVLIMQKQIPKVATKNSAQKKTADMDLVGAAPMPQQLCRSSHAAPSLARCNSIVPTQGRICLVGNGVS
jgi:hypothetical protein